MHGQCSFGSSQGALVVGVRSRHRAVDSHRKHGRGRPQEAQKEETARGRACSCVGGEVVGARASVCNTQ